MGASKNKTLFLSYFFANQSSLSIIIKFWCQNVYFFSFIFTNLFLLFIVFFQPTVFYYLIGIFINKRCIICFCSTKCVIMKPKSSLILPYYLYLLLYKKNSFQRCLDKSVFGNWT